MALESFGSPVGRRFWLLALAQSAHSIDGPAASESVGRGRVGFCAGQGGQGEPAHDVQHVEAGRVEGGAPAPLEGSVFSSLDSAGESTTWRSLAVGPWRLTRSVKSCESMSVSP
jgi:hypothetical protein